MMHCERKRFVATNAVVGSSGAAAAVWQICSGGDGGDSSRLFIGVASAGFVKVYFG
jgi:hypothetical protein